jgi:hypothetical protein
LLRWIQKRNPSNLYLGFIHVRREIGYYNLFNRLRVGTCCLGGIDYPSLGSGGCTGDSEDLSACTVTTTRSTLCLLGYTGSRNNLQRTRKNKKHSDEDVLTQPGNETNLIEGFIH